MNETAPPVAEPEAPTRAPLWTGLRGGATAFVTITAAGLAIGMLEYAVSGGTYRLWTWVKVGFLYVASFCTVSLGARVSGPGGAATELRYRLPLLLGTALALWLLARAGRAVVRRRAGAGPMTAGLAGAVVGFALPVFLVTLPASLRFPGAVRVDVSAVRWQAAVYPLFVGGAGVAAGAFTQARHRLPNWFSRSVRGGGRAFGLALLFGFIAFLVLATLKPGPTGAYARAMRQQGRLGALTVGHHLLMLPAQSVWTLAPSMGGETEVSLGQGDVTSVAIRRAELGPLAVALLDRSLPDAVVPLGGGFYALVLVPLAATVLGGRLAGATAASLRDRLVAGAGTGLVFALLVGAGTWVSGAAMPVPAQGWALVSVGVDMPSTVVLAMLWGVGGGVLGALTSRIGAQIPVPDPG